MRLARTQSLRPVGDIGTMVHTDWPAEASRLRLENGEASLRQAVGDAPTAPCLILYSGPHSGERWRIGRAPECEICLDGPSLSRRHADLMPHARWGVQAFEGTFAPTARFASPWNSTSLGISRPMKTPLLSRFSSGFHSSILRVHYH